LVRRQSQRPSLQFQGRQTVGLIKLRAFRSTTTGFVRFALIVVKGGRTRLYSRESWLAANAPLERCPPMTRRMILVPTPLTSLGQALSQKGENMMHPGNPNLEEPSTRPALCSPHP
jgi:hypothetical protein